MCINDHFMSKIPDRTTRRKSHFSSKTWHTVPISKLPLEPILRLFSAMLCAVIDLSVSGQWKLFDENGEVIAKNVVGFSHATLFILFAVLAVAEIIESFRKSQLPATILQLILSASFLAIGLVYYQFSQSPDSHPIAKGHARLLALIACIASVFAACESCHPKSYPLSFGRRFLTTLQGTWLFQMSFSVFRSNKWTETRGNKSLIALTFLWHILVLIVLCLICHGIMLCAVNRYTHKQDGLYNNYNSQRKVDEDSIPLGIVVNGNMLYDDGTSDTETLYP